jgi:farnesyl diphosphate synthase
MIKPATNLYQTYITRINTFIKKVLPSDTINLHRAMDYSTDGGKRLRALLVYMVGKHFNINVELLDVVAASVELIHAYSLIHDDLPCMDDDDLRRGKPTTHIQFSEAVALLAGDALQTLAFEILAKPDLLPNTVISDANKIMLINILAAASGGAGMVLGQQLDLNAESGTDKANNNLAHLKKIHHLKTGQLFMAAMLMPCYVSLKTPDTATLITLEKLAYHLGIAFQIQDDLIDELDSTITGKSSGSDARNGKVTYVSLLGKAAAQEALKQEMLAIIQMSDKFVELTEFILTMIIVA